GVWFPRSERGLATAIFDASAKFASAIGIPIVAIVVHYWGWRMSFVFTADVPGHWAFHCHLLYHMEMGMFRTILVS
ncbi:MAG: MFS transporter, partial [Halobacteriota archaeon]